MKNRRIFRAVLTLSFIVIALVFTAVPSRGADIVTASSETSVAPDIEDYENLLGDNAKDPEGLLDVLRRELAKAFSGFSELLSALLAFVILARAADSFFEDDSASSKCVSLAVGCALCLYVLKAGYVDLDGAKVLLSTVSQLSTALFAVEGAILVAASKPLSAAAGAYSLRVVTTLAEHIMTSFSLPLVRSSLALGAASTIVPECSLLSDFLKKISNIITVTALSVVTFFLSLKGTIASTADGVAMRSARFAVGSFVPTVGGALSEALGYVTGSLSYVKSMCGVMAICTICAMTLPFIMPALSAALALSAAAALSGAASSPVTPPLKALSSAATCVFTLEISGAALFIIRAALFVKAGA